METELTRLSDPEKKIQLPRFFKTGKGEYGEGDLFLGVVVPDIRKTAKKYLSLTLAEVTQLLASPYHEIRLCALLILVEQYKKADSAYRQIIYDFYLAHTQHINNWDLVDLSCRFIVGEHLKDSRERSILYRLSKSINLWERRIAVVSCYTFIKNNDFTDIITLSSQLLSDKHDLMHKATGWMLREMGKCNKDELIHFLNQHYKDMPRTMLRYSIEKLTPEEK
nr:DNA alkylation repair protein [Zophobihabitans entericus]